MSKTEKVTNKPEFKEFNFHGAVYKTLFTKKFENRKNWEIPDIRKMVSFIPGTIQALHIKEGDTVVKGQEILILEAMKMQNRVKAPVDGVIKKINVQVGDRIPKNHLIIEIN